MARSEKAIITNMCMVYDGNRILVQNRVDKNWGGICFPGGHVKYGESFVKSVIREVKEETGLTIFNPQLCENMPLLRFFIPRSETVGFHLFIRQITCFGALIIFPTVLLGIPTRN